MRPVAGFNVSVETGKAYPDFLLCGAFPVLIVSERVVKDLHAADIRSFLAFPVKVSEVQETSLRVEDAPP